MRYLLPAILLLGTQIASAQSILKDKDDKELSVLLNEWSSRVQVLNII